MTEESKKIMEKLNSLEKKLARLSSVCCGYHAATRGYLEKKGIVNSEEFDEHLNETVEFFVAMGDS